MSLGIYSKPQIDALFTATNPFRVTFHGRTGGSQDRLVYVRNDDILKAYSSIYAQVIDTLGDDLVTGVNKEFEWKLAAKQTPLPSKEWDSVTAGSQVLVGNIGSDTKPDIKTFLPLWVRVKIPSRQSVNNITDIVIRLTATEILV